MTKRPRRLPAQRKYESGRQDRVDRTQWSKPERVVPPITMPVTSFREISDEDIGLPRNDGEQLRAESYLACVIADRVRRENQARAAFLAAAARLMPGPTVHLEVPDDSVVLENPTDTLDETDRAILAELKRITARPPCRWMRANTGRKAG